MHLLVDYYESVGSTMAQRMMEETEPPSHPSWIEASYRSRGRKFASMRLSLIS